MLISRGSLPNFSVTEIMKSFPAFYFVNTNLPEKRTQVLRSQEDLRELIVDSTSIINRNNLDCYID